MAEIKKVQHAINTADWFTDGVKVLIDDYGDDAKWQQDSSLPGKELGAYFARASQIIQLSHYGVELILKVLYQQDYGKPFGQDRRVRRTDHPLVDIFTNLKEETKKLIDFAFADRVNTDVHGDLYKYPHSGGTAADVLSVCDGKYNLFRYGAFEMDNTANTDFSYSFAIVDVLQILTTVAKTREPEIMAQYGYNIAD